MFVLHKERILYKQEWTVGQCFKGNYRCSLPDIWRSCDVMQNLFSKIVVNYTQLILSLTRLNTV